LNPALNIEKGIYNATILSAIRMNTVRQWTNKQFVNIYKQRQIRVLTNLDPMSYVQNKTLLQRLMNKEILPHTIPFLSPEEMFPERWHNTTKLDLQPKENYLPEGYYTQYTCKRCGESKTTITEVQIRSADEPMTQFITCLVCNNRWRR
jgi:DNA-directed RNA polymerase subunit M/transcription elongation factor TFIIS